MESTMIYMDNAATTMHKPKEVIDAVVVAMSSMGNAGRGVNEDREPEYCDQRHPESGRPCDSYNAGAQFRAAPAL